MIVPEFDYFDAVQDASYQVPGLYKKGNSSAGLSGGYDYSLNVGSIDKSSLSPTFLFMIFFDDCFSDELCRSSPNGYV